MNIPQLLLNTRRHFCTVWSKSSKRKGLPVDQDYLGVLWDDSSSPLVLYFNSFFHECWNRAFTYHSILRLNLGNKSWFKLTLNFNSWQASGLVLRLRDFLLIIALTLGSQNIPKSKKFRSFLSSGNSELRNLHFFTNVCLLQLHHFLLLSYSKWCRRISVSTFR